MSRTSSYHIRLLTGLMMLFLSLSFSGNLIANPAPSGDKELVSALPEGPEAEPLTLEQQKEEGKPGWIVLAAITAGLGLCLIYTRVNRAGGQF